MSVLKRVSSGRRAGEDVPSHQQPTPVIFIYYSTRPNSTFLEPTTFSTIALCVWLGEGLSIKFNTSWTWDKYSDHNRWKHLPALTVHVTSLSHLDLSFSPICITKCPRSTYDFLGLKGVIPFPFRDLPITDSIIVQGRLTT